MRILLIKLSMYCNKCGKKNDNDSKFCQFCGNKIGIENSESQPEKNPNEESPSDHTKKSKSDLLWEKFAEVYDAKDDEKRDYELLSSDYIWELLERLYTNSFESFIQEKKDELNSQPYKSIEALKNLYLYSVLGGYKLWIAEAILEEKSLGKFKSFDIEKFVDEWKEYDFQKGMKNVTDEMGVCITQYLEHRMNIFIENFPSIKDVSNATMEELRSSITFQIVNGYLAGEVENTFRK